MANAPSPVTDHEIAVLCDVGDGRIAHFNADKRRILDRLIEKGFVEQGDHESHAKFKLTARAEQLLAERGVGLGEA